LSSPSVDVSSQPSLCSCVPLFCLVLMAMFWLINRLLSRVFLTVQSLNCKDRHIICVAWHVCIRLHCASVNG